MKTLLAPLCLALLVPAALAQPTGRILVSGYSSQAVHVFEADGTPVGTLGAVPGAQSLRYGPDGRLYAVAEEADQVLRFDGETGALLGPFVWDDPDTPADESGGLDAPTAAVFGPDGNLYVASFSQDNVKRYDGATGAYLDDFVPTGSGNINGPDAGMDFGPDGHLYVPAFNNNRVYRYHGRTGAPLGAFAPPAGGTLSNPRCVRWRGDGLMYVTSWGNNRVLRYDLDGDLVDVFLTVTRPSGLAFGPDGTLYVASDQNDRVRAYDGGSGAFLGVVVQGPAAGVDGATYVEFLPDPELRFDRPWPGLAGETNTFGVRNATPGGLLWLAVGAGTTSLPTPCPNVFFGVDDPLFVATVADAEGRVQASADVGVEALGVTLALQAYDPAGACLSNLVVVTFE